MTGEATMPCAKIIIHGLTGVVMMISAAGGYAEDAGKRTLGARRWTSEVVKTGKERLSDKASDDQRVDNCKVPLDRRGPKIRPEGCESAFQLSRP